MSTEKTRYRVQGIKFSRMEIDAEGNQVRVTYRPGDEFEALPEEIPAVFSDGLVPVSVPPEVREIPNDRLTKKELVEKYPDVINMDMTKAEMLAAIEEASV